MALAEDISERIKSIFKETWTIRVGQVVPEYNSVKLSNDAIKLEGAVLYADLTASTHLVDKFEPEFAAEIYKAYLYSAGRVIHSMGGAITAYDGDRVMAVFLGKSKELSAVQAGLKINYVVEKIINPQLMSYYPNKAYKIKQVIGIDTSPLFVARTGVRGANDLVWVGRAANYAAKLSSGSATQPTRITLDVHRKLGQNLQQYSNGNGIWRADSLQGIGSIYSTSAQMQI